MTLDVGVSDDEFRQLRNAAFNSAGRQLPEVSKKTLEISVGSAQT